MPARIVYTSAQGLYDRAPGWKAGQHALEQHWQRHLDGAIGYDDAINGVVAALQD